MSNGPRRVIGDQIRIRMHSIDDSAMDTLQSYHDRCPESSTSRPRYWRRSRNLLGSVDQLSRARRGFEQGDEPGVSRWDVAGSGTLSDALGK